MHRAVLMALLIVWSSSAVAGWIKLGGNDDITSYFDLAAIDKAGNTVEMWELHDLRVAKTANGNKYLSAKGRKECDCKEGRNRTLSFTVYSGNMGEGEVVGMYSTPGKWKSDSSDSIGTICKFVCAKLVSPEQPHPPSSRTSEVVSGIDFPRALGGFELKSINDLEKLSPGLGVTLNYDAPGVVATVYVYGAALGNIPDGVDSPIIKKHFSSVKNDVTKMQPDAQILDHESQLLVEDIPVLHSAFQYLSMVEGVRKVEQSHLYLTALKGNFIKIRITHSGSDRPELNLRLQTQFIESLCREMAKAVSVVPHKGAMFR